MWAGIKGIPGKQAGQAGTGIATLRAQHGKMVSRSKGKRDALLILIVELIPQARNAHN